MRRSYLFVPGDSERKLAKARQRGADVLILDWEDAVLSENKARARELSLDFVLGDSPSSTSVLIRCNPAGSSNFEEDCAALRRIPSEGVLLSKCRSVGELLLLDQALSDSKGTTEHRIYLMLESPQAVLNAFQMASSCTRVAGLMFGAEDFSAEMHITRTSEETELLYARSAVATAARAAGCEVVDSPCLEFKDLARVRSHSQAARNLGFSGKLAIHPAQVAVINEVFSPSAAEVEWARQIVDAFSTAGAGVVDVDGTMVDEAIVKQARLILDAEGGLESKGGQLPQGWGTLS